MERSYNGGMQTMGFDGATIKVSSMVRISVGFYQTIMPNYLSRKNCSMYVLKTDVGGVWIQKIAR